MKKSGFILLLAVCFLFSLQFAVASPVPAKDGINLDSVIFENKIVLQEEVSYIGIAENMTDFPVSSINDFYFSKDNGNTADASFEADNYVKDNLFKGIHYYNYYPFKNKTTDTDFMSGDSRIYSGFL